MLIHSVTPPHLLIEQPDFPEAAIRPTSHGYLEGHETAEGFQVSRLNSTDPSLYLKTENSPGAIHPKA